MGGIISLSNKEREENKMKCALEMIMKTAEDRAEALRKELEEERIKNIERSYKEIFSEERHKKAVLNSRALVERILNKLEDDLSTYTGDIKDYCFTTGKHSFTIETGGDVREADIEGLCKDIHYRDKIPYMYSLYVNCHYADGTPSYAADREQFFDIETVKKIFNDLCYDIKICDNGKVYHYGWGLQLKTFDIIVKFSPKCFE